MSRAPKKDVVAGAQLLLRKETPGLVVDGIWGPRSDRAYVQSPVELQQNVNAYVESKGWEMSGIRMSGEWISEAVAQALAVSAASKHGVPASAMLYFLDREPSIRKTVSGKEYRVDSQSPGGSFFGLFQMGRPAWEDAQRVDSSIGSFESGWRDPQKNANAAAAYIRVNMGYARDIHKYNGPFTDAVLYAMHNQGHTFISSARAGGMGRWAAQQSAKARVTLADAKAQVQSA